MNTMTIRVVSFHSGLVTYFLPLQYMFHLSFSNSIKTHISLIPWYLTYFIFYITDINYIDNYVKIVTYWVAPIMSLWNLSPSWKPRTSLNPNLPITSSNYKPSSILWSSMYLLQVWKLTRWMPKYLTIKMIARPRVTYLLNLSWNLKLIF